MEPLSFVQTRGTEARFNFGKTSGFIVLAEKSEQVDVRCIQNDDWYSISVGERLRAPLPYEGLMSVISDEVGEHTALIQHLEDDQVVDEVSVTLTVLHVRLDVDADRDGVIGDNEDGKRNWEWGQGRRGAIVLVNNDRDTAALSVAQAVDSELTEMLVRPTGMPLPEGCDLVLAVTRDEAARLSLYRAADSGLELVLGVDQSDPDALPRAISPSFGDAGARCFLEAHEYPGPFFEGLISFELRLLQDGAPVGNDRALVRVAPWMMTPHTRPAVEVFTCDTRGGEVPNERFLDELQAVCDDVDVPLRIVPLEENGDDRWIQDEVEFGYSESPVRVLPVVCDSPRDRELDHWAKLQVGPDMGHFQLGGSTPDSLDSFGNLEVSPPVTVRGRRYPFGRIVFGGRAYGDYGPDARQMMPELRRFLYAQRVQFPIELYTDWLLVGHIDEILTFVPADNEKGFQILLTSPRKAEGIIDRLLAEGHGEVLLFEGLRRGDPETGEPAEMTVRQLRDDGPFWEANARFQSIMDLNREMLMMELEISGGDIIEVPALFWPEVLAGRTGAFFPNLVNQLVLGDVSIVPRPYGPRVHDVDVFEQTLRDALPGRDIRFVDDWYSYHELLGEVHCGTNTRRRPPTDIHWWEFRPEGGFDI